LVERVLLPSLRTSGDRDAPPTSITVPSSGIAAVFFEVVPETLKPKQAPSADASKEYVAVSVPLPDSLKSYETETGFPSGVVGARPSLTGTPSASSSTRNVSTAAIGLACPWFDVQRNEH
jgi:hypothetical protein